MHSSRMRSARSLSYGVGLPNRDPLDRDPSLERDLLDRDPLDRDPLDRDSPGQRHSPGQRLPSAPPPSHVTCGASWDRDPFPL